MAMCQPGGLGCLGSFARDNGGRDLLNHGTCSSRVIVREASSLVTFAEPAGMEK